MTPDPNSESRPSPDKDSRRPQPEAANEEDAIDLGHLEPVEEGASALSFSGRAGSQSGGSSSGVRSWKDLVRETASDSDADNFVYDASRPTDVVDPDSDKDLLKQVLADDPPPSSIVLKDPSLGEAPALRVSADDGTAKPFALPPDLAATRPGDSSVLSEPAGPSPSGIESDVWGSSSRVDLLRAGQAGEVSSGSLERTDEMSDPPLVAPPSGDSSISSLGAGPIGGGTDGSAVDLGSRGAFDLPFSHGLDSGSESQLGSSRKPGRPSGERESDSGTVDLLATGDEFDVGLIEPTASPSWAEAREDLPPTVPMVPAGKTQFMAWAGGGVAGLLAGIALCAGLWFAGLTPTKADNPSSTQIANTSSSALIEARGRIKALTAQHDDQAKKAAAMKGDLQQVRAQLTAATTDLTKTKAASAAQVKKLQERADMFAAQAKQNEAAQVKLNETIEQLTNGKATADTRLREVDAALAEMRSRLASATAEANAAKNKSETAEATAKKSAAFVAAVAQRLSATPAASLDDLLGALDQALTRPASEIPGSTPVRAAVSPVRTPEQLRQAVWSGFYDYRAGNYAGAEADFRGLTASPAGNAIHWYYLGLAQWRQGRLADAESSFRHGWALERASRPPPGEVEAAFERLDRADRDAVNLFRR